MNIQHFKTDASKTILWAHGTSTELFIYSATGNFQARDFLFRLSTATVEAEETVFSSFPAITRTLMVLKGNLTLIHDGRYTKSMQEFEQDTFQGDWDTKSKGIVTDFNLMCKEGASGTVNHILGQATSEVTIQLNADFEFFYVQSGRIVFKGDKFETGDLVVIESGSGSQILFSFEELSNLVHVSVKLN